MPYLVLVFSWSAYFVLHSLMAITPIKAFLKKKMHAQFHFYRLAYNLIATVGLLGLLVLNGSIPAVPFFDRNSVVLYTSLMLSTFGVFIISAAFRQYKVSAFLGFREEDSDTFSTHGILNKVRHPIYSGTILIVIGFFLYIPNLPTLISVICIFVYLVIGIYLEEKKLIQKFGDTYLAYKKRVPMLAPRIF